EKILCDADLDYLGRDDFFEISNKLFQEMKDAGVVENEREWNLVQRTFLQGHRYHTGYSKAIRESGKQQRLNEIVEQLKKKS
ncbi:MAG: hydrolase, partial [Bacteroidota bacterium]